MVQQSLIQQQNLWKAFLVFLLPLIATNILQSLSGTINTVFVGQMLGVNAIAAVAVFFPILFCFRLPLLGALRFVHLLACFAKPSLAVLIVDYRFAEVVLREIGPELVGEV